jgi:hypothetical protein
VTAGTGIPGLGGRWQPADLEAVRALCDALDQAQEAVYGLPDSVELNRAVLYRALDCAHRLPDLIAEVERLCSVVEAAKAWLQDLGPTHGTVVEHALADAVEALDARAGGEVR